MLTMARISWLPRKAEAAAIELDAARRKFVEHARVRHKVRCPWLLRVHPPSEITRFARTGWWMPQSDANRSPTKLADFQQRFLTKHASSVYMELPMAKFRKADFSPKIRLST